MTDAQLLELLKKVGGYVRPIHDENANYGWEVVLDEDSRDLLSKWLTAAFPAIEEVASEIGELSPEALMHQLRSYAEHLRNEGKALTYDRFGPPTGTMMCDWLALKGQGMKSAVGEYTPDEFWYLLDVVQGQQAAIARMAQWIEQRVSLKNGGPDYLCPAGRVQLGLPAFAAEDACSRNPHYHGPRQCSRGFVGCTKVHGESA